MRNKGFWENHNLFIETTILNENKMNLKMIRK